MKKNLREDSELEKQGAGFTRRALFTHLGLTTALGAGFSSLSTQEAKAYPAPKDETATRYRNSAHIQRFYQLNRK